MLAHVNLSLPWHSWGYPSGSWGRWQASWAALSGVRM